MPGSSGHQLILSDPYDDYYLIDPPRRKIAYPLKVGEQWIYEDSPWSRIDKRVVGRTTIELSAGTFDCWEIQWTHTFGDVDASSQTIEMTDYIADIGVVARYMRVNGLLWTGYGYPDSHSGFVDYVEYYELEEYDVD